MVPILVVAIITATVAIVAMMLFQGKAQQAQASLLLGSGVLQLVAFFFLSWVRPGVAGEIIQRFANAMSDMEIITGWTLTTNTISLPVGGSVEIAIGDDLRIMLAFVLAVAVLALVEGAMGLSGSNVAKPAGLALAVVSVVAMVLLILSLNRIVRLDMPPSLARRVQDVTKAAAGMGVWITFIGIIVNIAGGLLLWSASPAPPKGRARDTRDRRSRSTRTMSRTRNRKIR